MKAQTPAEGIMKTHDFGDSKFYKIECTCGNADDSVELIIETEDDLPEIQVSLYTTQKTEWWKELFEWNVYKIDSPWLFSIAYSLKSLINGFTHRVAITRDVWFNGYVKYSSTIFMSKQQALNFAETIKTAIKDVEEFDRKKKS